MPAEAPLELSDEPLVGWRCWHVLPHEGLLRPIYKRGLVWKPRQAHEAICPEDPHEVPGDGCKCGIWAVCHPMLLQEVAWTFAPPEGIPALPGVVIVGQVSLWGRIVEHERGWRASAAYPRHLYALTDDPMVAETLRERYGVPVEWGQAADRLRRLLPPPERDEEEPETGSTVRETLLDVLRHGAASEALVKRVGAIMALWKDLEWSPAERRKKSLGAGTNPGWKKLIAHAEARALDGNTRAARRALWVRLARWQRCQARELWEESLRSNVQARDGLVEDLARGRSRGPTTKGQRYAPQTFYQKQRDLERVELEIVALVPKIEALCANTIPTYREWCEVAHGVVSPRAEPALPSEEIRRQWHRQAMRRQAQLAEHERTLALKRHQLVQAREALDLELASIERQAEERRAQLAAERATLREDVIASIERDRAALLEEVGVLERRRRAALAFLPGPWPPSDESTRPPPGDGLSDDGRAQGKAPCGGDHECGDRPGRRHVPKQRL